MSRFKRASHVIWHCQYHLVWVPKYRFQILSGSIGQEVQKCVMVFSQQLACEVVELNVQMGSCALVSEGAAQAIDIGADGSPEGAYDDQGVQCISAVEKETLLGQSFLGEGLLC